MTPVNISREPIVYNITCASSYEHRTILFSRAFITVDSNRTANGFRINNIKKLFDLQIMIDTDTTKKNL